MNYEQFICAMLECTKKKVTNEMLVEKQEILKNNGVREVGVTIRQKKDAIAPLIYMEAFYEMYQEGVSLEELTDYLLEQAKNAPPAPVWDYKTILDFEKIKDQIVYKLISAEKNAELLKKVPYLPMLDFAIVFYVMVSMDETENCSVLIRNEHMDLWKAPISVLYQCARHNTPKLCPPMFCPLDELVFDESERIPESPLLLLSNERNINGAAAILYPGMIQRIYDVLKDAYYLLPTSIHEFLILPEKTEIPVSHLRAMLQEVNETHLKKEEILSSDIYYFDGNNITKM